MHNIKKLHWKCRRGMKEMDILFEHYLYEYYESADEKHQKAFESLCEHQDPLVADYLFERVRPPSAELDKIIQIMRAYSLGRQKE